MPSAEGAQAGSEVRAKSTTKVTDGNRARRIPSNSDYASDLAERLLRKRKGGDEQWHV